MSTLTELFNTQTALSHKYENVSSAVHASRLTLKASPGGEGAICQVVLDGVTITPDSGILGTRLRMALLQYITGTPSDSHDSVDGAVWNLDAKVRLLDDGNIVVRPFHRLNSQSIPLS